MKRLLVTDILAGVTFARDWRPFPKGAPATQDFLFVFLAVWLGRGLFGVSFANFF